jgi:CRISPR-associated endonuclease/helicase Cas3
MNPDDFPAFYRAVHGYEPFPWQVRLARQVAENGWPAVLALPTAAGKTSTIDVALFTLALQAGRPLADRTAPLRTFFVIDRRLVVDQAAAHARCLKQALEAVDAPPVVREVARSLARFGGPGPLHVAALRGGMYRDDSWARSPAQPTICVSTVDQIGSRLLFRGYGLSEYRRPVHAGLTGNDALYLLDEAHLSQPFLETLQAVGSYRGWAERPLGGPFVVVEVSATPATAGERFGLLDQDRQNPVLRRRLNAPKPAKLEEPDHFEAAAVKHAREASKAGPGRVVGVVVNRVASARRIFEELRAVKNADAVLLTGRIRPWDRERLLHDWLGRMRVGRARGAEDRSLFVVATQTVEVGADLDFDFLVTEAAPLAALRQRFGRLDRLGEFGQAGGVILLRKAKGPDPIYGDDLADSWAWLRGVAHDGVVDFGVDALDARIRDAGEPPPSPAERHAPVMLPAYLDTWAQTSPVPQPDPDVAPFLHGGDTLGAADVQVVWRADLAWDDARDPRDIEGEWVEVLAAARPVVLEALPVMAGVARAWLQKVTGPEESDVEGLEGGAAAVGRGKPRRALRWRGPDDSRLVEAAGIAPGDTLVVPSAYGGADEFGWDPQRRSPVRDVGDACLNWMADSAPPEGRRPVRLRLHPALYRQRLGEAGDEEERREQDRQVEEFARALERVRRQLEEGDAGDSQDDLRQLLLAYRERLPDDSLLEATVDLFLDGESLPARPYPGGLVLTRRVLPGFSRSPRPLPPEVSDDDDLTPEDDTASLLRPVPLTDHAVGVVEWVDRFAHGLDEGLVKVLRRAAWLHDLGKADPRFQVMLYGGDPLAAAAGELLAKSGMDREDRVAFWRAWQGSGLPPGFRHEFVSVALVRHHGELLLHGLSEHERELVEYLVGTHHGRGRPFVPVVGECQPEAVTLTWDGHPLSASPDHRLWRLGEGWTDLFWKLVRRYGVWGLAYLEAVLTLSDQARSHEEEGGNG